MKKLFSPSCAIVLSVYLFSCSSPEKPKEKPAQPTLKCTVVYDSSASVLEWTAFKFTEKTPVKGTFTQLNMKTGDVIQNEKKLIESLSFTIPTESVETQNPERNGKIFRHFFGTFGTKVIEGKVKELRPDGKALIVITMNKITKDVEGTYSLSDKHFSFDATIDVANWNALPAIAALNKICKDLHTGKDGQSKLWSEIELSFTTVLKEDCN